MTIGDLTLSYSQHLDISLYVCASYSFLLNSSTHDYLQSVSVSYKQSTNVLVIKAAFETKPEEMLRVHVHLSKRASGCHTKIVDASTSPLPLSPRRSHGYLPHYPSISMTNTKTHQRRARCTVLTRNKTGRDTAKADTVSPRKDCEKKGNNVPLAVR